MFGMLRQAQRRCMRVIEQVTASEATWPWMAVVVLGLLAGWLTATVGGSAVSVNRHLFYLPVTVAAVRFGIAGALSAATAAGVLAGPLVPLPPVEAAANTPAVWAPRMVFFVLIGAVTAVLVALVREVRTQQAQATERARSQQLTVIQTLSHEFRTPLTLIRGAAETLQRDDLDASVRGQMTAMLHRSSRNLETLLDAVLAAAGVVDMRSSTSRRRLAAVVRTATGDIDRPDVRDRVTVDCADGWVSGQTEAALGFIVRELVTNALKYSPEDEPVRVELARTDGVVSLTVTDHGPGMDPDSVQRALAPFSQQDGSTTREREGLGLGLFAVERLVDQCEGQLALEPHPAGGLVASVQLHSAPSS